MLQFSYEELTVRLLKVPFMPGAVGRLGLFTPKPQYTTTVNIEVQGERLALVPDMPRGAPPTPDVQDRAFVVAFKVPHFPIRDTLFADAVQDMRGPGRLDLATYQGALDEHIASIGRRLDVTLEHLRLGAAKGIVITAVDRVTGAPLRSIDLFEHFGVTPQDAVEWPIINAGLIGQENPAWSGQLTMLINDVARRMADELPGGVLFGIHGFCGAQFFDAVTQHPERRAAYIALDAAPTTGPILGQRVTFRNITFEEYRGRVGSVPFVAADECHFVPVGVPDLFCEIFSPADYVDTVNTIALPRYLKQEVMPFGKGTQLEGQQNVLPLCTIPRCLFTAKAVAYEAAEPVRVAA